MPNFCYWIVIIGGESAIRNTSVTSGAIVNLAEEYGIFLKL